MLPVAMVIFPGAVSKPVLLTVLLFGIVSGSDAAGDARLEQAESLVRDGNFAPAWCIWQQLSEAGNLEAKFNLGWLYHNGQGVARDDQQALQLWEQAARQGHAEAQMALGMLYSMGGSIARDPAQAVKWYHAAAGQGIEDALLILFDYVDRGNPAAAEAIAGLLRDGRAGTATRLTVDEANVREQPSLEARVLTTLPEGARVRKLYLRKDWWRVWVENSGETGWMYHSLFD